MPSFRFTQTETSAILKLVDKLTIHEFDLSDFTDEYDGKIRELIEMKTGGRMFKIAKMELQPVS